DQMTILRQAKNLAIAKGLAPAAVAEGMRAFREKGRLTEASVAQRRRLGLPPTPEAPVEELQALLAGGDQPPEGEAPPQGEEQGDG
ncbi:MAG: hypothetical protein MUQ26_08885, partial [Armatimonadetes bacterium]|nr:hypothetical protein [Armatimonadota bacterium]